MFAQKTQALFLQQCYREMQNFAEMQSVQCASFKTSKNGVIYAEVWNASKMQNAFYTMAFNANKANTLNKQAKNMAANSGNKQYVFR